MVPQVFRASRLSAFSCAAALGFSAAASGSLFTSASAKPLRLAASPAESARECPSPAVVKKGTAITPVTKANYARAETEVILADYVAKIAKGTCSQGVGVFLHLKAAMDPKDRTILRPNFDTLYSFAVLDLESPATVVLPETDRYQILEVVDEDHWIPIVSDKPGRYALTKEAMGSRYVFAFVRTQVNMQDPSDLAKAGEIQDQIKLEQSQRVNLYPSIDTIWSRFWPCVPITTGGCNLRVSPLKWRLVKRVRSAKRCAILVLVWDGGDCPNRVPFIPSQRQLTPLSLIP